LDFGQDPKRNQGISHDTDWLKSPSDASLDLGFDLDEFYPEEEEDHNVDQEDSLPIKNLTEIEELVQQAELLVQSSVALKQRTRSMEFWEEIGSNDGEEGIPSASASFAEYSQRKCFASTTPISTLKSISGTKKHLKSKKCISSTTGNSTEGNPLIVVGKVKSGVGSCCCPTTVDGAVGGTCRCEVFGVGESDIGVTPSSSSSAQGKVPKKQTRVRQWVRAHNQNSTTGVAELVGDQKVSPSIIYFTTVGDIAIKHLSAIGLDNSWAQVQVISIQNFIAVDQKKV
jgi:hypothetical protein